MLDFLKPYLTGKLFSPFAEQLPERLVVFGTGARGRRCRYRLEGLGIAVPCFADNDPARQGTTVDGLPVVSPAGLLAGFPDIPVIVCSFAGEAIVRQLRRLGLDDLYTDCRQELAPPSLLATHGADIEAVHQALADAASRDAYAKALAQRFFGMDYTYYSDYPVYAHPEVRPVPGDCCIDGGAAAGDTLELFSRMCGGDCTLYLFEPTRQSFAALTRHIETRGIKRAFPVAKALWDQAATLRFTEIAPGSHGNHVAAGASDGTTEVEAIDLDSFVAARGIPRVDLIKLDIEGSECSALRGARETIARFRPKLQICLYHKIEDFWELPLFLKQLVPEYRLYVGLHSCCLLDVVLYCAL